MAADDAKREDKDHSASRALTPTPGGDIAPFIAAAEAAPRPARGLMSRLLDYSAHAAIVVGLVGAAWTIGSHLSAKPTAAQIEAPVKTATATPPASTSDAATSPVSAKPSSTPMPHTPTKTDELADLRTQNRHLSDEISAMRANIEALRARVTQEHAGGDVRTLKADLKTVQSGLASTKAETDAALAQLSGKVEKLQHETPAAPAKPAPSSKMQQLVDRLGRLEHGGSDTTSTGSIKRGDETSVAKTVPTPPAKPGQIAGAKEPDKTQVLAGWVVRDVYDGVALIEGKRGPMEVVPGVAIPGAGVVRSIDRKGNGWTVTTSKGLLAYAAPPHDYRRTMTYRAYDGRYPDDY